MNDMIGTRRLSVADTLEVARQALHTHRSWMKSRVAIAPGQAETETQDYTANMDIFTSNKSEQLTLVEEVSSPAREVIKQQGLAAPPPFAARRKIAPGSLPVGKGTPFALTTGVPSHFYGTQTTEEQELSKDDVARKPISAGGSKMVESSSSQRRRTHSSSSRSRVVPATGPGNHDTDEVTSSPTSSTQVFYSKSNIPTQNAWTEKPIYTENIPHSSETEVDSHRQSMDATMNSDLSQSQTDSLLIEGDGLILPVSPAPKEQQSTYSAHTQSKIRAAEESLEIISQESEEVIHSPSIKSPATFRLPINKMDTLKKVEPIEVGDTFLHRVLPTTVQETVVANQRLPMTTVSMDDPIAIPEDIETVDLFSAASPKTKATMTVENDSTKSKSRMKTSPTVEETSSVPPTQKSLDDTNKLAVSTQESLRDQTHLNGDNTVQLPQSLPSATGAWREGGGVGVCVGGGGLRDLKLRPLIQTTSKVDSIVDGNEMVQNLPMLKSPLSPYLTGFVFSSKRERAPPLYAIHRPPGSMGLVPSCPLYGVSQPRGLSDLHQSDPPSDSLPPTTLSHGLTRTHSHTSTLAEDPLPPETDTNTTLAEAPTPSIASGPRSPSIGSLPSSGPRSPSIAPLPSSGPRSPSMASLPSSDLGPGPLHLAARSGNLRRLQSLINMGHDVDLPDHNGQTPLMYCIHLAGVHLSCADALIREGANVNKQWSLTFKVMSSLVQSSDGSTAMHLASSVGGVALIELMILNGARTDVRDFDGRLPLHWATIQKSPKVIATLLDRHSELGIDVTDDVGMTPLMWAAYNNNAGITSYLLGRGADREEKDADGYTAMHWGVHREGTQCLQLLLKPDMTYFKDHKGRTVILFAAEQGAMTTCEIILKMRGDAIYDTDKMGRTPLHYAAACGRVDVCALLLGRGADATQTDSTGRTALDYARVKSMDYVVALLTCHGTAIADFARASRSTSVESLMSRDVSFGQLSESVASLAPQRGGALNKSVTSLLSNQSTITERPGTAVSVGSVTSVSGEGVDVVRGGYLGRFVSDKTDPLRHFFFRLSPDQGTVSWGEERGDKNVEVATILEVNEGPSNAVKLSPGYSPEALHKYVFWIMTSRGVLDLLAYNENDYSSWIRAIGQVAVTNAQHGDVGQGLKRQQRIRGSGVPSAQSISRGQIAPSPVVDHTQLSTERQSDITNVSETSALFVAPTATTAVSSPVRVQRSSGRAQVGVASGSHVTEYKIPKEFKSDIFMTSTPKAITSNGQNDII